jgi:hypothetical protein
MEYKGVPVDELYKLWLDQQDIEKKRGFKGSERMKAK